MEGVIMLDRNYYKGFEGEGQVRVWSYENSNEIGMVIWIGFLIQFYKAVLFQHSRKMEL